VQADPLLAYRERFPILERSTYFAAHTLGPVSRESLAAINDFGRQWAERGVRAWGEGWWALPERVGDAIGRLMNAPAGSVITCGHATEAMAGVLSSIDFGGERDSIVTTSLEFPSVLYQVLAWGRHGARVAVVPSDDGLTPPLDGLLDAIDERTRLVSICHVYFRNAAILDLERVVRKAHEVGALVVLDAYQSLGTVPLDVTDLRVDYCIGGSVKWVLGGPGVGYLYARPGLVEALEPSLRGWSGHEDPFAFAESWRPAVGARRFATGTPNVPALAAALPGYEMVNEVGVERIREKSLRQTGELMRLADEAGLRVVNPRKESERGGSVVIDPSPVAGDGVGHAISAALNARDFVLDFRPSAGIRLAPHFYTRDDELSAVIGAMVEVIETRAYDSYLRRGRVT
jgi:kynureninase